MPMVSEFGMRWDERVPRDAIKRRLGRTHVSVPDDDIVAMIEAAFETSTDRAKFTPALRRQTIKFALEVHRRNRELFTRVMQGNVK